MVAQQQTAKWAFYQAKTSHVRVFVYVEKNLFGIEVVLTAAILQLADVLFIALTLNHDAYANLLGLVGEQSMFRFWRIVCVCFFDFLEVHERGNFWRSAVL